jgi:hypothetical protein
VGLKPYPVKKLLRSLQKIQPDFEEEARAVEPKKEERRRRRRRISSNILSDTTSILPD